MCKASVRLPGFMNLRSEMFAKYCHLCVIHLTVTTVYFHPGVSVSLRCQSTNNILLCFDKSVCQAGGERRDRRDLRPRMRTDTQRSENNRECLTVLCV